jgi:hypothetical protein
MNSTPTDPTANQTQGYPPRTRTSFLSGEPDGSGFEYYIYYGHQQKGSKKCVALQERWHKTHLQLEKDRPENSLVLRMLHLLCWSRVTCHQSPCCKHHRSDSSGLESFLIVNVPAKGAREGGNEF